MRAQVGYVGRKVDLLRVESVAAADEALHVQFYLTLLDTNVTDPAERAEAFAAVENIPSIQKEAQFCFKWIDSIETLDELRSDPQCGESGLLVANMREYLQYVADRRLEAVGVAPVFGSRNPFSFMELQDVLRN